jgi:hypothetical protein
MSRFGFEASITTPVKSESDGTCEVWVFDKAS